MNRAALATTTLACLAGSLTPVFATPAPVDEGRTAGTQLSVTLPDRQTLTLEVRGVLGTNGPLLLVNVDRCDDSGYCDSTAYSSPLTASELGVDPSNPIAHLHATLGDTPVTIDWKPGASGVVVGGGELQGGGTDATGSQYAGSLADVTVHWGDNTCSGSGGVGTGLVADTAPITGNTTTRPISALRLPDEARVRCTG